MGVVTSWACPYCGSSRPSRSRYQFARCLFCTEQVIDCGDFAIRVSEERWWEKRS